MEKESRCPFCVPFGDDIVARNTLCYARWDRFPVTKGHLLIMPFRHTPDYFSLTPDEKQAMTDLIDECRKIIEENFRPAGYNIGYNIGAAAGQTVMHCHCHFIPRYPGDTDNPRGGVRRVVAGKYYHDPRRKAHPLPATRDE
jgi:diadenosine tetraphosphate (Ap4A) HIT family hydrolase